ncbi:ribosome maturation factor RimM [Arcobacter porcinus]|uniref:Ribosome maturation factor RimM n=1 Tax=Arcobacter porcinus TaxID=1935204 RepID=A0A1C0B1A3_9BACT|nr:ribosome maturation factor RimM [Arcobacter porcinus]OCL89558.1 Ribosome maturation factor RimM [Aliarcobacter thereius]OCL82921.1 Ribosome maturation factor RimM [Arcobacter porcinus]OCL88991.1 Ribosome maturation factor RimM [Arcobacter porcinus]OCL93567.1 Ribosome maturation factor RimM [Arcobacter porcinus]QEP39988.1 16S rRNA processing protein [Arcobacter porcinus]
MNNKVYVAKLGKTVGLQGHLRLFIDSDFPNQFKKDRVFFTNKKITLKVLEYNVNKELIKFEDYEDIDSAKKLTNMELFSTIEDTKESCILEENEHFWFDLMDCEVYEDDLLLGKVSDIHRFPLNDYLQVETSKELVDKELPKSFLIPHIFDNFILKVDIESKKIFVKDAYDILENS